MSLAPNSLILRLSELLFSKLNSGIVGRLGHKSQLVVKCDNFKGQNSVLHRCPIYSSTRLEAISITGLGNKALNILIALDGGTASFIF
jgi:hypothetical protein